MTVHLQRFVDRVRGFEARGAKDFTMSMSDAKDLHADVTRLLLELQMFKEQALKEPKNEVVQVNMDGGTFR
jgi:hypothetical protein